MTQRTIRFVLAAALVAMGVWLIGTLIAGAAVRGAITLGVGSAFAFQALAFWLLAGWAFPDRPALVYGLGMLGRFLLVALVALVVVPGVGVAPVPTLFSLVATLFATTLIEPVFFKPAHSIGR